MSSSAGFSVDAVMVDVNTGWPVVLLRNEKIKKTFTINVSKAAAFSVFIAFKPNSYPISMRRPLWVDLFLSLIHVTGCVVKKITIDHLTADKAFTAKLMLSCNEDKECIELDCLPSEAIIVALRSFIPIWISEEVIAKVKNVSPDCATYRECSMEDFDTP